MEQRQMIQHLIDPDEKRRTSQIQAESKRNKKRGKLHDRLCRR